MFKRAEPFFLTVITPLHVGSGNDLGFIDLPIQREVHTGFPKVEGSSLKGAIREAFDDYILEDETLDIDRLRSINPDLLAFFNETSKEYKSDLSLQYALELIFGHKDNGDFAACLGFTDARLLLFPVKSMRGIFKWITCPYVYERFLEDLAVCNKDLSSGFPDSLSPNKMATGNKEEVVLEEFAFKVEYCENLKNLVDKIGCKIGLKNLAEKLIVLENDDFSYFVRNSTEAVTRNKINSKTGVVKDGALFSSEYLPAESVIYSLALASPVFKKEDKDKGIFSKDMRELCFENKNEPEAVLSFFKKYLPDVFQLGGDATIGKGIVKSCFFNPQGNKNPAENSGDKNG